MHLDESVPQLAPVGITEVGTDELGEHGLGRLAVVLQVARPDTPG
jgi:hypothetical protein